MKIKSSTTQGPAGLPSRFNPGDIVYFNAYTLAIAKHGAVQPFPSGSIVAKVVSVKFEAGKVLYDLALGDDDSNNTSTMYYEVYPICNVDSCFISAIP